MTTPYFAKDGTIVATRFASINGPAIQLEVTQTEIAQWVKEPLFLDEDEDNSVGTLDELLDTYSDYVVVYDSAGRRNRMARGLETSRHYANHACIRKVAADLRENARLAARDAMKVV